MAAGNDAPEQPNNTLLLDLAQSLGRIEGQNQLILQEQARAAEGRKEQYQKLDEVRRDVREVKSTADAVATRMTTIEPDVAKMKGFRAQIALAVVFVTAVVNGALSMIWYALTHLGDIKTALREFLK